MKRFAVAVVFFSVLGLLLVGCGSNNPANINGNWNATLLGNNNTTAFTFGTTLTASGNGSVTVSNFSFTTSSACFASDETETGSFTLSGNFSGQVNGSFGMIVQSGSPAGNTLTLSGTAKGNTITGTWTLAGSSGCTGSGTFTMTKT